MLCYAPDVDALVDSNRRLYLLFCSFLRQLGFYSFQRIETHVSSIVLRREDIGVHWTRWGLLNVLSHCKQTEGSTFRNPNFRRGRRGVWDNQSLMQGCMLCVCACKCVCEVVHSWSCRATHRFVTESQETDLRRRRPPGTFLYFFSFLCLAFFVLLSSFSSSSSCCSSSFRPAAQDLIIRESVPAILTHSASPWLMIAGGR